MRDEACCGDPGDCDGCTKPEVMDELHVWGPERAEQYRQLLLAWPRQTGKGCILENLTTGEL